jgi:hypothetical protein
LISGANRCRRVLSNKKRQTLWLRRMKRGNKSGSPLQHPRDVRGVEVGF